MTIANQLMTNISFATGRLFMELPGGFTGDPRNARPVLVQIRKLGSPGYEHDKQDAWTLGRVCGGGKDDGKSVRISGNVAVYEGGYILCALPDDKSTIAAPMMVYMQMNTGGGTFLSTSDAEIIYSSQPKALAQHAVILSDVFDAFANQAYVQPKLNEHTRETLSRCNRLSRIRNKHGLSRRPFYDNLCPEGFVAWVSKRVSNRIDLDDIAYLISRGRSCATAEVINLSDVTTDPRIYNRNCEVWGLPAAITHESFLPR